jgi:hypothetical protein
VSEKVVGNFFGLAQGGDGAVQITGIPQDDRGDEEVQAGRAMLLIFVGAVANFPEPMDEDGVRQAVARDSPLLISRLVCRRNPGSSSQSSVNKASPPPSVDGGGR